MNVAATHQFNPIMQWLLKTRTQPFKQRKTIVIGMMAIVFIYILIIGSMTNLPIQFLPLVPVVFYINWLLGLRYNLIITLMIWALLRLTLELTNRPSPFEEMFGVGGLVIVFLALTIIGGGGGILGELIELLYQQYERTRISEEKYRQVVENTSDIIYITTASGHFSYISPAVKQLTGYDAKTLIGEHFSKLVSPQSQEKLKSFYRQQFKKRTPETVFQFPVVAQDKSERWVEQRVVLQFKENKIIGFHSIVRDIQKHKDLETEINEARNEAIRMEEVKSQILANVSHDARTPLSAITLSTEMLLAEYYGPLVDQQKQHLKSILEGSKQLLAFLQNLVDQAKLDANGIRLAVEALDPKQLVEDVSLALKPLAENKDLYWKNRFASDLPTTIKGDRIRLLQVISNLVNNAIKFTEKGGIDVELSLKDENHWSISVKDTGLGISTDARNHIFDPFWQVDGGRSRQVQTGVGLGLSITQKLVTLMGGEIIVTSELYEGSNFQVNLPVEITQEL